MFRRCFTLFLALVSLLGVLGCPVAAQEDGEKTAPGQVLEQLCTGFPYPGYERFKEVPQYFQQDYRDVPYGGPVGNVATHGCGITALAMLASYMCDEDLTPAVLAPMFLRYSSNEGTAFNLMDESAIPLGYHLEKRSSSLKEVIAALEKGQMVISLQFADHFTTTAHFIVLTSYTEDGKITVRDSNVFNHTGRFAGTDLLETGFEPGYIHQNNRIYWIYCKKLTRYPGCDRCEDPNDGVDTIIENHLCRKCTRHLTCHGAFKAAVTAHRPWPEK